MKKLLTILSLSLLLVTQVLAQYTVDYYPAKSDNNYSTTKDLRKVAYAVMKPTDYTSLKKYPVVMMVHGIGERSEGKTANLVNIVEGFDYGDGIRKYAIAVDDLKTAIAKYQIIAVLPTYDDDLSVEETNIVFDSVIARYSIDTKRLALVGFSLGGGAVVRYITSSVTNANRLALAVPVAPVAWATTLKNVVDAKLPVAGFVNSGDKSTNTSGATDTPVIKAIINGINALNPTIPATLTIVNANGHGGSEVALSLTPGAWPATYFNTWKGNIYEWLLSIDSDNPATPPGYGSTSTGTTTTTPTTTGITAVIDYTQKDSIINLDASKSTAAKSWEWSITSVPTGASLYYGVFTTGAGWVTAALKLPVSGSYVVKLRTGNASTITASSTVAETTSTITWTKAVTTTKMPTAYSSSTGLLTFSDGTTTAVTVTIDWAAGKVVAKTSSGTEYILQ